MGREDRPNFVFILIDDLGWRDLFCYGSSFYETPNIDALCANGLQFTDAYASAPVCSPTRASLMTGKYPARVGVTQYIGGHSVGQLCDVPYFWGLPLSEVSLARALGRGGYATWHVGKWHLGDGLMKPENHGFERNIGGCGWGHPHNGHFSPYGIPTLSDGPRGEYLTDRLTDEAIRLIEHRDDRPFFLNLWYYAVHNPIQAPEALVEKYRRKASRLGLDRIAPFERGESFPCIHKRDELIERRILQSDPVYAAMIESLDQNIGRLVSVLSSGGLLENTVIVFTSDNGGLSTAEGSPTCNAPLSEGKGWMYEGGTRIAQILQWKGRVTGGAMCDLPVSSPDWYPTILDLAGLARMPEQHVDGESFADVILGGQRRARETPLFWHYPHYSDEGGTPSASIRDGDHKLIKFFEDESLELYDLRNDIGEQEDLSERETKRREQLHERLTQWQREVEALIPRANPNWQAPSAAVDPAID